MPLTLDDILVQPINKGGVNATSAVTSLGSATTAGNTLLIFATTYGTTGITTPSGYTRDTALPTTTQKVYVYRKSNIGAGETLPTLATGASTQKTTWFALEVSGLDLVVPLDVASAIATATAQSISTATIMGWGYDTVAFCLQLAQDATSVTAPTWSGQDAQGGWAEVAEQGAADATTSTGAALSAWAPLLLLALNFCPGTSSLAANGPLAAVTVKYFTAASKTAPDYRWIGGFEWATSAGLTTGIDSATATGLGLPPLRLLETTTGTVVVGNNASNARNGNGYLEIGSGTSGVHNATVDFSGSARVSLFYPFRFGTLPATDTELCTLVAASGVNCVVRFIAATGKVGVKLGTATEQVSAAAITAGAYHTVDLDYDMTTGGALAASWRLNGVDQTQATNAGTATSCGTLRLGWSVASAAIMRVDDAVVAGRKGNWPLGDHKVVLVGVDPAGTLSVDGSTANFNVFSDNGTMAAWNAATAKTNLSEGPPPTIGATAAGIAQVTAASVDYAVVPMATYAAAANEAIRAARLLICGWAASGTANNLSFDVVNPGVESLVLFPVNDPQFDNSTTAPAWLCRMINPTGGWTQAWLDALEIHMGASTDATPDAGMHWPAVEVAVAVGQVYVRQENDSVQSGDEVTVPKRDDMMLLSAEDWVATKVASHVAKGWSSERTGTVWHVWKIYTDPSLRKDRYFEVKA